MKKRKKIVTSEAEIQVNKRIEIQKKQKGLGSEKECSSSYLSHKSFNIDKLLVKSMQKFQ